VRSDAAIRPTRVDIDLEALCHNARILGQTVGQTVGSATTTQVYAVVKADAYGHGAEAVALALQGGGHIAGFAVSLVEEGSRLRDAGVSLPILVMGPAMCGGYDEMVGRQMTPIISDLQDLAGLDQAATRAGKRVVAHLKIDTGMARLGITPARLGALVDRLHAMEHIEIAGMSTHFACADSDDPGDPGCMTHTQLRCFDQALAAVRAMGLSPSVVHAANSAATLRFPEARRDLVRCGLALYGNSEQPGEVGEQASLRQAMRLVSCVVQLRDIAAGSSVSYGALWRAPRATRLAVLPIGYADGVPRRVTGKAQVLIAGRRCPLVGAVTMDIAIADVTDLGNAVKVGDEVVLLGQQHDQSIAVREFATWAGVLEYEVTCGVSQRVPRVYVSEERTP
jgi:alanine racemase